MNRFKYLYLFWLLPAIFVGMMIHQTVVYYGVTNTYNNGESYNAEIVDLRIRQVASQTSGTIVLRFDTKNGKTIRKKMSLPYEMSAPLQKIRIVPVRYQPGAFQEVVMIPTYSIQRSLTWSNILLAFAGFVISFFVGLTAHRYANKKLEEEDEEIVIERVD